MNVIVWDKPRWIAYLGPLSVPQKKIPGKIYTVARTTRYSNFYRELSPNGKFTSRVFPLSKCIEIPL